MRITEFFQVLPPLLLAMVPGDAVLAHAHHDHRGDRRRLLDQRRPGSRAPSSCASANSNTSRRPRSIGARNSRIILRVVLPNAAPPLIVSAALSVGVAILFEAGLSFLGLSDPNVMSWGYLIGSNRPYILDAWWAVTFPGIAIFLTVLAVSLIGDGLNDALNPKLRRR